jgi:hypothetical protein
LAKSYLYMGRYAEAEREFQTLRTLRGGGHNWDLGIVSLMRERPQEALEYFASIPTDVAPHMQVAGQAAALCDLGRELEAQQALDRLAGTLGNRSPLVTARAFAHCGNSDAAFEWLERSLPKWAFELQVQFPDPLYAGLRDDPRWADILERIGRSEKQTDAIPFSLDAARLGLSI